MTRKYEQTRRAATQEETRDRIVKAAIELHGMVGPARTSVSAVAERAGVQRNTLYRHFPDDRTLLLACSSAYLDDHPVPNPAEWSGITDPGDRARKALRDLYAYWESTEQMNAAVLRDAEVDEVTRDIAMSYMVEPMTAIHDAIVTAWPRGRRRKRLAAATDLAMSFRTWQSLVRTSGLTSAAAADLMATMLVSTAA
jgi:AcrR family transcriptional regulator